MAYHLEFRSYQFPLKKPLTTNYGSWSVREGIIIRLINELGRVNYGEIAPISWFGSETMAEALQFCQQLPSRITQEEIWTIPDRLPASQFGFGSAWENLEITPNSLPNPEIIPNPLAKGALNIVPPFFLAKRRVSAGARGVPSCYSYLLPTGIAALESWQMPWQQGYRTFKWKIGVEDCHQELDQLQQLVNLLPVGAKLRLDANGGLNLGQAKLWLGECDQNCDHWKRLNKAETPNLLKKGALEIVPPLKREARGDRLQQPTARIEFLEQPLPVENFRDLLILADRYDTPIALDESVATLGQLKTCYAQGWRGIFVIKPSIAGYGDRLREFCQNYSLDAVFSSSLETAIGRNHALKLAQELSNSDRALGFGVDHWLEIDQETLIKQLWQGH